jgi:hypothetical protein
MLHVCSLDMLIATSATLLQVLYLSSHLGALGRGEVAARMGQSD